MQHSVNQEASEKNQTYNLKDVIDLTYDHNKESSQYAFFYEHIDDDLYNINQLEKEMQAQSHNDVFLIVDDTYEGVLKQDQVDYIIENIAKKYGIKYAIFSSNEILQGENVYFYSFHIAYENYDNIDVQGDSFSPNLKPRNKLFLSLNRHTRFHRLELVDHLIKHGLLDHSYVSCNRKFFEKYASVPSTELDTKLDKNTRIGFFDENIVQYTLPKDTIDRLDKHLPLVIDINEEGASNKVFANHMPNVEQYFQNSYWSLIGERDFYDDRYRGWTEKVLKSIFYCHPFIVIGLPHTLKSLRAMGFITFSSIIDESYDDIEDHYERFAKIKQQIDFLGSLNYSQHFNIYRKLLPILKHNRNHYLSLNNSYRPTELVNELLKWCCLSYKEDYNRQL